MQVGAADSGVGHADQDIVDANIRPWDIVEP
jgi:hypothetical protein